MPVRFIVVALVVLSLVGGLGGCFRQNSAPQQPRSFAPNLPAPMPQPAGGVRPPQRARPAWNGMPPQTMRPARTWGPTAKPSPPQEIVNYLAFLKTAEDHRQSLISDTGEIRRLEYRAIMEQIELADEADGRPRQPEHDPFREYAMELDRQYSNWAALLRCLDSHKPPAECIDLATAYRTCVYVEAVDIWRMGQAMKKAAGGNVEGVRQAQAELTAMRNDPNIRQSLETAEGDAQALLRALRLKYDLRGTAVPDL